MNSESHGNGQQHDCHDPNDPAMFSHIALSLSGGGVRAVGFHLGVLDLLERLELLENVHILSTVSGGSLTGTAYALSAQENKEGAFQHCFHSLYDFLPGLNTLEEILDDISGTRLPSPSGRRDLIAGMANVFHEFFYSKYYREHHFGVFWEGENHIKEIMFNATEFRSGNAFRFQKSQFDCRIGNGRVWMEEEQAKKMRMADVMASSCCIPVGMEPIFFPDDFHWPDDEQPGRPTCTAVGNQLREERSDGVDEPFVAIMDGGVYDNQGLTSVLLAMLRRDRARDRLLDVDSEEPDAIAHWAEWVERLLRAANNTRDVAAGDDGVDLAHLRLFIISDTPLQSPSFYPKPDQGIPTPKGGRFARWRLWHLDAALWFVTILLLLSVADNVYDIVREGSTFGVSALENTRQIIGVVIPTLTCGLLAWGLFSVRRLISRGQADVEKMLPPFRKSIWHYARKLRVTDAMEMVQLRLGSVSVLTTKIYLNRIRQLGYSTIFGTGSGEDSLADRVMANEIFTLSDRRSQTSLLPEIKPGSHIERVGEMAATMKTAVWVDPTVEYMGHREMDILVAAGQMTTCYNLMRHLRKRYGIGAQCELPSGSVAERYYNECLENWRKLEENPFALVDERKREVGVEAETRAA